MKIVGTFLLALLVLSLLGSVALLYYALSHMQSNWQEITSELLLVIVIAAEGIFAVFHIDESRAERQAESLRDFMHGFITPDALEEREELFEDLPWGHNTWHVLSDEITWVPDIKGELVRYRVKGNDACMVEITMKSKVWRKIQRLVDQYHFAGLSCKRGYMSTEDVLTWMGPAPLRWWRRLGGMVKQERVRRGNPTLFQGFEDLAASAEKKFMK